MAHILFESQYGSTKQYAEELAQRLNTSAEPLRDAGVPAGDDPIIVMSYVHGPTLPAAAWIAEHAKELDLGARPVAVAAVGMSLSDYARERDQVGHMLGSRADHVKRFYLPGRLNYSELSGTHGKVMTGIITAIRLKPGKSDNDRSMISSYNRDVDRVDVDELGPIVAWAKRVG